MPAESIQSRRAFLSTAAVAGAAAAAFPLTSVSRPMVEQFADTVARESVRARAITVEVIEAAEQIMGLSFTDEQRELMLEDVQDHLGAIDELRAHVIDNGVMPAQLFDPRIGGERPVPAGGPVAWTPTDLDRPASDEDLAFLSVAELSGLLKARRVTAVELTELYLSRLERYDPQLEAVVTLTPDRARAQARAADAELDAGLWRGPLHGIPWGAKDLLAVPGYPTTWGAEPYREQMRDETATVVERLDAAGAILVAKLTLGALAWGDVWFGGRTRNPWNLDQGSSGSSAGPGSAVAAGLVGFAIGSETLGSIVSPSTRNGVTGLRPSYGRVSRHGAMALSWSMDKLGPMCRSAEDCALVFDAIHGRDERDHTTVDGGFDWPVRRELRVGYVESAFEGDYNGRDADLAVLDTLRAAGLDPQPMALPDTDTGPMLMTLNAEAAAAFDALMRSGGTDRMVRQVRNAWPNVFRHARFVSAVDFINANRLRTGLVQDMAAVMAEWDVVVCPSFRGNALRITNLTGHPCVCVPNRFDPVEEGDPRRRAPGSISFIGALYRDDLTLAVAAAYQSRTDFHRMRPPIV